MMQFFVDDSGVGAPPIYVLAGLFASDETWVRFSDEWEAFLIAPPPLKYWKTTHAVNFRGQFTYWDRADRDAKLRQAVRIFDSYRFAMFAVIVDHADFQEILIPVGLHPYPLLLQKLQIVLGTHLFDVGEANIPVEFIFDNHEFTSKVAAEAWSSFREFAPSRYKETIAKSPIFRDEKDAMPLQAADLLAWYIRKEIACHLTGKPKPDIPWIDSYECVLQLETRFSLLQLRIPLILHAWANEGLLGDWPSGVGEAPDLRIGDDAPENRSWPRRF